jgi:hypothetical protein
LPIPDLNPIEQVFVKLKHRLRRAAARGFAAQQTEAAIGAAVRNRMLVAGRPDSVRQQPVTKKQLGVWAISPFPREVHQCRPHHSKRE